MAIAVQQIHPVAHLPLVLGVLRRLEVATVIDHIIPPHPAHGLSCGRGVEAVKSKMCCKFAFRYLASLQPTTRSSPGPCRAWVVFHSS
jgi:hypothetical protein